MEIRLTNTVEAPEAVTDSTGVVIGMDLDPVDVASRKNINVYVGGGLPRNPEYTLGISFGSPNFIKIYKNVQISEYLVE